MTGRAGRAGDFRLKSGSAESAVLKELLSGDGPDTGDRRQLLCILGQEVLGGVDAVPLEALAQAL